MIPTNIFIAIDEDNFRAAMTIILYKTVANSKNPEVIAISDKNELS